MAGHMGTRRRTQQNLQVVKTDPERGLLMVKGSVPGAEGGYVLIKDAVKRPAPKDLPYPAALKLRADAAAAPVAASTATTAEAPAAASEE